MAEKKKVTGLNWDVSRQLNALPSATGIKEAENDHGLSAITYTPTALVKLCRNFARSVASLDSRRKNPANMLAMLIVKEDTAFTACIASSLVVCSMVLTASP